MTYKVKIINAQWYADLEQEVNDFLKNKHYDFLYDPEIKISSSSCMATIIYEEASSKD